MYPINPRFTSLPFRYCYIELEGVDLKKNKDQNKFLKSYFNDVNLKSKSTRAVIIGQENNLDILMAFLIAQKENDDVIIVNEDLRLLGFSKIKN